MTGHGKRWKQLDPRKSRASATTLGVVALVVVSLVFGNRDGQAGPLGSTSINAVTSAQSAAGASGAPTTNPTATTVAGSTATTAKAGTATTAAPTTTAITAPKNCASSEYKAGFGCPVIVDGFDGTSVNADAQAGWTVYDYPNANFPRVANNLQVDDGQARLTGTYDRSTGTIVGAGISSHFSAKYGRWEVRMAVEAGRGYSAAVLLWPTSEKWPTDGEIDLLEIPAANRQKVFETIHNGARNNADENVFGMDATKFHTYAVEWTPASLKYYVDNTLKWTVTKAALVPSTGDLHLTIQMDPGTKDECGAWFECPDGTTPARTTMYVDYAKIWSYSPASK